MCQSDTNTSIKFHQITSFLQKIGVDILGFILYCLFTSHDFQNLANILFLSFVSAETFTVYM
jgi:hypothetical protein